MGQPLCQVLRKCHFTFWFDSALRYRGWIIHRDLYPVTLAAFRHNFHPHAISVRSALSIKFELRSCVRFTHTREVPKVRNDDPVPLTIDLLNPKLIGFDSLSRTSTVPSFKSFRSVVFIHRAITHTYISSVVTKWSHNPRCRTTSSARIAQYYSCEDTWQNVLTGQATSFELSEPLIIRRSSKLVVHRVSFATHCSDWQSHKWPAPSRFAGASHIDTFQLNRVNGYTEPHGDENSPSPLLQIPPLQRSKH